MNAKERVMAVLNHQKPDRMPCFGANCMVTYDQMEAVQAFWPKAHEDGESRPNWRWHPIPYLVLTRSEFLSAKLLKPTP